MSTLLSREAIAAARREVGSHSLPLARRPGGHLLPLARRPGGHSLPLNYIRPCPNDLGKVAFVQDKGYRMNKTKTKPYRMALFSVVYENCR